MANKDQDKHFDIASPSSISAGHTSRPVIVGNNTEFNDPMMRNDESKPMQNKTESHKPIKIQPVSHEEEAKEDKAQTNKTEETDIDKPKDEAVDDSIVDTKSPSKSPQPSQDVADRLIQEKTYQLPIHRFGERNKLSLVLFILLTVVAVAAAAFVIIS